MAKQIIRYAHVGLLKRPSLKYKPLYLFENTTVSPGLRNTAVRLYTMFDEKQIFEDLLGMEKNEWELLRFVEGGS